MGCGTCEAICPSHAIGVELSKERGQYFPTVSNRLCTQCGLCLNVCPGVEVDFDGLGREFLGATAKGDILGTHRSCYFAHASDQNLRYSGSSGGLITALLLHSLERGIIDGALVTGTDPRHPLRPRTAIAETSQEISAACGSKYCPTNIGAALRDVVARDGKYAVVALPCQLHGIRKLETVSRELRSKIVLHFGLFCSNNNTFLATEYFLKKKRISPDQVGSIRYRDKGWPGVITVTKKDGTVNEFRRGTTEKSFLRKLLFSSAFHYDFQIPRCLLCADLTSELADISFADPWNPQFLGTETVGKSMIVVRTQAGQDILRSAQDAGAVETKETDGETVKRSQGTSFKASVGVRIRLRAALGRPVPSYPGKKLDANLRSLFRYCYITPYLTHCRRVWPLLTVIGVFRSATFKLLSLPTRLCRSLVRRARRAVIFQSDKERVP